MSFMQWLAAVWHRVRAPLAFLRPIRFVVGPQLILLWAMNCSSQGKDTVRAVVEFSPDHTHPIVLVWFCVAVFLLALQSWYWSRQLLRVNFDHVPSEYAAGDTKLEKYAPRYIGGFAFVIAILSIGLLLFTDDTPKGWLLLAIGLLLAWAGVYATFVIKRRDWVKKMSKTPQRVTPDKPFDRVTLRVLRYTALAAVALIVWTAVSPLTFAKVFPSPPLLMISAALWVGIGSWLVYRADWYRVPIFGLLFVLAVLFSFVNDNHDVRKGDPIRTPRPTVAQQFTTWYGGLPAGNKEVFVVATEGGGIRAAYWTAAVLAELQDRAPAFSDHLFAISGVSGGSIGATVFTALVADGKCNAKQSYRGAVQQIFEYDALAPTLARFLQADLAQRFLPFGFIPDRQRALEAGWVAGWRGWAKDSLLEEGMIAAYRKSTKHLPSLFLNGTVVELGNRTIGSNCAFTPNEIRDAHDTFATLGTDMPWISAAGNSARFPYISPAGTLRGRDYDPVEHVVDGGYFEDSGTGTAAEIIATIASMAGKQPIHLIIIRFDQIPPKPVKPEHYLNEIASPLRALIDAWGAHTRLAVAEGRQLPNVDVIDFDLGEVPNDVKLPLGWLLAERSRVRIDAEVGLQPPDGLPASLRPTVLQNAASETRILALLAQQQPASSIQSDALNQEKEMAKK